VVRSHEPFKFWWTPTISLERLIVSGSHLLSTQVDGQCGKMVTVIGHQFITLTVDICAQHGGREALRRAGLSTAAETCLVLLFVMISFCSVSWQYFCLATALFLVVTDDSLSCV